MIKVTLIVFVLGFIWSFTMGEISFNFIEKNFGNQIVIYDQWKTLVGRGLMMILATIIPYFILRKIIGNKLHGELSEEMLIPGLIATAAFILCFFSFIFVHYKIFHYRNPDPFTERILFFVIRVITSFLVNLFMIKIVALNKG